MEKKAEVDPLFAAKKKIMVFIKENPESDLTSTIEEYRSTLNAKEYI